ncbi:MAG: bifunctional ADP-heptose synthase [Armatimonadetes bacterium]|nr:bifunctional ADP-heptose synthase [Armatimonadota bacterium]
MAERREIVLERKKVEKWVRGWQKKRVVVVGDLMLDEYIFGTAERISPEAPVPVIRCEKRHYGAGGAGNTARNLSRLGAQVAVCGVVGDDEPGRRLIQTLNEDQVETSAIVCDPTRPTTVKTRIVAHHQQVARLDVESRQPLSATIVSLLKDRLQKILLQANSIIVSDYAKGLVGGWLTEILQPFAANLLMTAGPKPSNMSVFKGFHYLSLNRTEALSFLNGAGPLWEVGSAMVAQLSLHGLVVTLGGDGCLLFGRNGLRVQVPALRVQVYDVAGAGDTFLATVTLALLSGCSFLDAAAVATVAAASVVRKVGVATVTGDEILHLLPVRLPLKKDPCW